MSLGGQPGQRRRAAQGDDAVQELLKEMDDLLAMLPRSAAAPQPAPTEPDADEPPSMVLQCDVNGCTIVPVAHAQAPSRGLAGALPSPQRSGRLRG